MRILIEVKPNSTQNKIEKITESVYKIWVSAPPIEGKANKAIIELLAKHFKIAKSLITIKNGKSSKTKVVEISA